MSETSAPVPVHVAKHDVPTKNKELEEHVEEAEEAQDLDRFKKSLSDSVDRLSVVFDKLGKPRPGLDESFYQLEDKEAEFFKQQTGISDDEELKQHITKIQTEAYAIFPYPCIRRFAFTKLKISRFPAYERILKLGRERPGALFLDIGCCFGNDVRKFVADGFPASQAIASDLKPEFWDLGHKLFCTTPESFPATFIPGDAFDSNFIAPDTPLPTSPPTTPLPPLSSLKTLTPLQGRLSAIFAASFFHLFNEEKQLNLAHRLASLLSPEPGSIIFGAHGGRPEKGWRTESTSVGATDIKMWCHCPESWKEMWEKEVFKNGEVKIWTVLVQVPRFDLISTPDSKFWLLVWSVTRV